MMATDAQTKKKGERLFNPPRTLTFVVNITIKETNQKADQLSNAHMKLFDIEIQWITRTNQ